MIEWLQGLIDWLKEYGPWILQLMGDHLLLSFLALALACAMAIPLGILLGRCRFRRLAGAVISLTGIVQPIPSLALVALAAVLFLAMGVPPIGICPGLLALVAYAILPVLRNTYTGIRQVDPTIIEVATGMGMRPSQVLVRVQLPLALPVIMAGVRIATVWTIGIATLVSLLGANSLGKPIFQGISGNRIDLILGGTVPAVALALLFDWLLGMLESHLTPSGMEPDRSAPP